MFQLRRFLLGWTLQCPPHHVLLLRYMVRQIKLKRLVGGRTKVASDGTVRVDAHNGKPFLSHLFRVERRHVAEEFSIFGTKERILNVVNATAHAVTGPVCGQAHVAVGTSRGVIETTIVPVITKTVLTPSRHVFVQPKVFERHADGHAVFAVVIGVVVIVCG